MQNSIALHRYTWGLRRDLTQGLKAFLLRYHNAYVVPETSVFQPMHVRVLVKPALRGFGVQQGRLTIYLTIYIIGSFCNSFLLSGHKKMVTSGITISFIILCCEKKIM